MAEMALALPVFLRAVVAGLLPQVKLPLLAEGATVALAQRRLFLAVLSLTPAVVAAQGTLLVVNLQESAALVAALMERQLLLFQLLLLQILVAEEVAQDKVLAHRLPEQQAAQAAPAS